MSATLAPQLCSPLDESPVGLRSSSAIWLFWLFWHFMRRLRASARGLRFKWNILLFKRNDNGIKLGDPWFHRRNDAESHPPPRERAFRRELRAGTRAETSPDSIFLGFDSGADSRPVRLSTHDSEAVSQYWASVAWGASSARAGPSGQNSSTGAN